MNRIRQYYLMCTVRNGGKQHIIEEIHSKIDIVYKQKEVKIYFKQIAGKYVIRENIVGGDDLPKQRQKILVF